MAGSSHHQVTKSCWNFHDRQIPNFSRPSILFPKQLKDLFSFLKFKDFSKVALNSRPMQEADFELGPQGNLCSGALSQPACLIGQSTDSAKAVMADFVLNHLWTLQIYIQWQYIQWPVLHQTNAKRDRVYPSSLGMYDERNVYVAYIW